MSAPDPNGLGDTLKRAADAATPRQLDLDAVLRASRARRRTRRSAVVGGIGAAAAVVLVGGGLMAGLQGLGGPTTANAPTSFQSAESGDAARDAAEDGGDEAASQAFVAPWLVNRCGASVAAPTDTATSPLTVAVDPPATPVRPATTNPVAVTITNSGQDVVEGMLHLDAPLTVAASGVTVWNQGLVPDVGPLPVSLGPGESASLEGSFETRSCDEAGELDGTAPALAPGLDPGEYGLSAIVSFTAPDGAITYLISPLAPISVG